MLSVNARAARREGQAAARSLGLEAARLDQLAPFLVVRFDNAAHLSRTIGGGLETRSKQNPLRVCHRHDLGDLGVEPGDTILRRAARREQREPRGCAEAGNPASLSVGISGMDCARTGSATPKART